MRNCHLVPRIIAFSLSGFLTLPNPAFALRIVNPVEAGLEESLAAGLEERRKTEQEFVRSVGGDLAARLEPLLRRLGPLRGRAQGRPEWQENAETLEWAARQIEDQGLLHLQPIADQVDPAWAQDARWLRYERHFYYVVTSMIQQIYGLAMSVALGQVDQDTDLRDRFLQGISQRLAILESEVSLLQGAVEIPEVHSTLSDEEWEKLVRLQEEHWRFFGPLGEYVLPTYASLPSGTFVPSPFQTSAELLKAAGVGKGASVFDAGSGAGHALIAAAVILPATSSEINWPNGF